MQPPPWRSRFSGVRRRLRWLLATVTLVDDFEVSLLLLHMSAVCCVGFHRQDMQKLHTRSRSLPKNGVACVCKR